MTARPHPLLAGKVNEKLIIEFVWPYVVYLTVWLINNYISVFAL